MPSKRIAIFSAQFLPNIGGVEKYTDSLARELKRLGYEVVIVTTNASSSVSNESLTDGIEVVRLPCFPLIGGRMPIPRKNAEFKRLWRMVESYGYHGVLVNTRFYFHSLLGLRLAKRQGFRGVLCEHGSAYLTFGNALIDRFVIVYEHLITALVKRYKPDFYAVSSKGLKWLSTFNIEGRGVLSNAIDADTFCSLSSGRSFRAEYGIASDVLIVSFIGRFAPEKGVDALIRAMRILETRDVSVRLLMAGVGPLENHIREAELSNVTLVGKLDAADVAALMKESDLFCLPTRSEGFSTSLLEASAVGTPALITDVGGVAEMIPDASFGIVIEDARPETIATAIENAAMSRDDLVQQGAKCYQRVRERYSWERTATDVLVALGEARR